MNKNKKNRSERERERKDNTTGTLFIVISNLKL